MSYICLDCGNIFEDGEIESWVEPHGETMYGCPMCRGNYEEAVACSVCGSEHLEEDLNGGVCDDCINGYRRDFDFCYHISLCEEENISINALLISLFDKSDIEAILIEHIKNKMPDVDCSQFIDEDISWFGERLAEEVRKNEQAKG